MTTRIGILSDTHSCWDDRYITHFADCNEIWHAGDIGDQTIIERLADGCSEARIRAVTGNIDHGVLCRMFPEVEQFEIDGLRVWMTHIGGYPGRYRPGVKHLLAQEGIGLMITGHSHILKVMPDPELNQLHINPGAAGWHGWQRERTLVKLTVADGRPTELDVITLAKNKSLI